VPTATPTPLPTPEPSINFWADRTTINAGECTILRWDVDNIQAVWVYPQGADYTQFPTTGQGSKQVCPAQTTTYEMRVQLLDGTVQFRQITITVNQNNPLLNTGWVVASLQVNQVPLPGTSLTIFFGTGNFATGSGGCNSFNGSYSAGTDNIRIGPLTSGKASCGPDIDAQEQQYYALLQQALSYSLQGNQLIIFGPGPAELLRFNRSG
jgi:heat shock protein HslJ